MASSETFHQPSVAVGFLLCAEHPPCREPCQSQRAQGMTDAAPSQTQHRKARCVD
jgi:hypothetical protein